MYIAIGSANWQSRSVPLTSRVEAAEPVLGSILLKFKIIGYAATIIAVTQNHLIARLFQMKALHSRSSFSNGGGELLANGLPSRNVLIISK